MILVTPDDLVHAAGGSVTADPSDEEDRLRIRAKLAAAQARVEGWLSRRLPVHKYTLPPSVWQRTFAGYGYAYAFWAPEWPIVQSDVEGAVVRGGAMLYAVETTPDPVTLWAGYRREDQTLEDLQEEVPDLEVLPPVLPADLRDAVIELALIKLNAASRGTLGSGRVVQQVGTQASVTVESVDRGAENRVLRSLRHYQRAH
jgi:hypothetical protein